MSDGVTADETDRDLGTGKGRKCLRKDCITYLVCLTAVGLLVALAPMPTMAGEDERVFTVLSRFESEMLGGGHKEIEALEAKVASLQATVCALQGQVTTLQTQLAVVQSNHALALGPFVSVDPNPQIGVNGPNITFTGANIHIVSGSGSNPRQRHSPWAWKFNYWL